MAPRRPSAKSSNARSSKIQINRVQAGGVVKSGSDTSNGHGSIFAPFLAAMQQGAYNLLDMVLPERSVKALTQAEKGPFLFLELPPEIRNQIYDYLIPQKTSVAVRVVDSDEYGALVENKMIERTSFERHKKTEGDEFDGDAIHSRPSYWRETITYAMEQNVLANSLGLLGVNRQTRLETLGLFYGKNTFHFDDWRTLKPFLVDRPPDAMELIEGLSISMYLSIEKIPAGYEDYVNNRIEWGKALQSIGKLPKLRLKGLFLHIDVERKDFIKYWAWGNSGCNGYSITNWMKRYFGRAISNLDELGLQFHFLPHPRHIAGAIAAPSPDISDIEKAEEVLWNCLAPKLLHKVEGRPHKGPELLDRRVFLDQGRISG